MSLPVTILGGYLGVGKTTLLNHLLRDTGGLRLAVLVNDFGDINIDADLIESRDGNVLNLAGGCVCCSVGSDLVAALLELPQRPMPPDHILIETSGVALPGSVAFTVGLVPALEMDAVIVVVDAETVRERASDRYVGDTVCAQLAQADLIVANKLDLVDAGAAASLDGWLRAQAPGVRIVHATQGSVPAAVILGMQEPEAGARHGRLAGSSATHGLLSASGPLSADGLADDGGEDVRLRPVRAPAAERFSSVSFEMADAVDLRRLALELVDPALGVVRAKGLMRDRDGTPRSLQLVGSRTEVRESGHADPARGRLVCIGLRGQLDRAAIAARLELSRSAANGRSSCSGS